MMVKKKALILKKRKNLKIEADPRLLNLKNLKKIVSFSSYFLFLFSFFSLRENLAFFIKLESLSDFPLYLFDILLVI